MENDLTKSQKTVKKSNVSKKSSQIIEACDKTSAVLNSIIQEKGYDYMYKNPMEVYAELPKKRGISAKLSNAVMYALLSNVANKNRNKLSVIRSEIENLSLEKDLTRLLDRVFSTVWEENYLKDAQGREYGGYEEFCFRLWDTELAGSAVWTSADGKKKLALNYKYNIKFKAENSNTVFSEIGPNHFIKAEEIAAKYKKGLEDAISQDFSEWVKSSPKAPKIEDYDTKRGTVALDFYLEDHGLVPLTVFYEGNSQDIE